MRTAEKIRIEYESWISMIEAEDGIASEEKSQLLEELRDMSDDQMEDAFYRDLAFGTGGLRGIIGAGSNRMNVVTVQKASQGLAEYLLKTFEKPHEP